MKRTRVVALSFVFCLAVSLAGMAWISWTAFQLERTEAEAWDRAETEERVRLALWRMDSSLAPLLTQEIARPRSSYRAFHSTEQAYGRLWQAVPKGEILVPSPLLAFRSPHVKIHFEISPKGVVNSPQVPTGNMRDVAEARGHTSTEFIDQATGVLERLRGMISRDKVVAALPIPEVADNSPPMFEFNRGQAAANLADSITGNYSQDNFGTSQRLQVDMYQQVHQSNSVVLNGSVPSQSAESSANGWEFSRRGRSRGEQERGNQAERGQAPEVQTQLERNDSELAQRIGVCNDIVLEGCTIGELAFGSAMPVTMLQPLWIDEELFLARRTMIDNQEFIQGCWLDWDTLKVAMRAGIEDLLPDASLEPLLGAVAPGDMTKSRLASLPVRLIPGAVPTDSRGADSTVLFSLGIAWICVLIAAIAVVTLVGLSVAFSERRRGFVSAVTHEMRTPLTTFRLYTEMLSEGMVRDETKKQTYLSRLRTEADRLGHLVENVLAFAGLESGRARRDIERVSVNDLVSRVRDRLADRASQADMTLEVTVSSEVEASDVELYLSGVEQILLNLVDNACKYAGTADDRRIHLEVTKRDGKVEILVRDHGCGISAPGARRLFRPFSKSVDEAAVSAPGVGLGLALSRRFAREMGGELILDRSVEEGAAFVLRLPISA